MFSSLNALNGTLLRITTRFNNLYPYDVAVAPLPSNETDGVGNITRYQLVGGYATEIFLHLQIILGFKYELVQDIHYYDFTLAEEYNVDLFMANYNLYADRAKLADPSLVTAASRVVGFINHEFESNLRNMYTTPFSGKLWIGVIAFFMAALAAYAYILHGIEQQNFMDIAYSYLTIVMQKENSIHASKASSKLAVLCISMACFVMMATYSGNMYSSKTNNQFFLTTLDAIVNSKYKILLEIGTNTSAIFRLLKALEHLPVIATTIHRIETSKYVYTTFEQVMMEVQTSPSMYILDEETGLLTVQKVLGSVPCTWSIISILRLKYQWCMYMRKNSKYRHIINHGILRLKETGLLNRMWKKWIPHTSGCFMVSSSYTQVNVFQTYPILFIFLIGLVMSSLICIVVEMTLMKFLCARIQK